MNASENMEPTPFWRALASMAGARDGGDSSDDRCETPPVSEAAWSECETTPPVEWLVRVIGSSTRLADALRFLASSGGALHSIAPFLAPLIDVEQSPVHHAEGSAWQHTLLVVEQASNLSMGLDEEGRVIVLLAAMLHDVGKQYATQTLMIDGVRKISSIGHERYSAAVAWSVCKRLGLSRSMSNAIVRIAQFHMVPMQCAYYSPHRHDSATARKQFRKLLYRLRHVEFEHFTIVCTADQLGRKSLHTNSQSDNEVLALLDRWIAMANSDEEVSRIQTIERMEEDWKELGFEPRQCELASQEFKRLLRSGLGGSKSSVRAYLLKKLAVDPTALEERNICGPAELKRFYEILQDKLAKGEIANVAEVQAFIRSWKV